MFEFRNGMLGVTIIALAIAGAIVGGYLGGIESVEHDVTKFNYLADVSGLYDYDTNPQYIEYDPSSNYTGYYSTTTGEYWPTNGVEFTPNEVEGRPVVNNYKIIEPPISVETTVEDVSGETFETETAVEHVRYIHYYSEQTPGLTYSDWEGRPVTLKTLIDTLQLDEYTILDFSIHGDWPIYGDGLYSDVETPMLVMMDNWNNRGEHWDTIIIPSDISIEDFRNATVWPEDWNNYRVYRPIQSMHVENNAVTLYTDDNFQERFGTYSLNSVLVCLGDSSTSAPSSSVDPSSEFTLTKTKLPPTKYLNPNYGVSLKEE